MGASSGPPPGPRRPQRLALPLPAERGRRPESLPPGALGTTVLFIGTEDDFSRVVASAVGRYGVHLEHASPEAAVAAAVVAAPDLIVLSGRATDDGGRLLLGHLQAQPETSVIPVALILEDQAFDARLRAFRHGAAAVLPKKASTDELARRIAELAREIPSRSGETLGQLGEVTLEELVQTLATELRSGILSVEDPEGKGSVRLVLGGGKPMAALIEDFVQKTRAQVQSAAQLRYEFDARAGGTIQLLEEDANGDDAPAGLALGGLRVVLADENAARAEAVAHELRQHDAEVIISDLEPSDARFSQIRLADPSVLLIGEEQLQGAGYQLTRRMRQDTRLRWVSLLVVRWSELWRDERTASVERLASALAQLTEPEHHLLAQAEALTCFDARLETVGPARTLRSLSPSAHGLRVTVTNPRLQVELDLANGLVIGAVARVLEPPDQTLEGVEAVAALLQLSSGRVQVDRVAHPARANLMAAVDMALALAAEETPPILPSLPAAEAEARQSEPTAAVLIPGSPSLPSIPVKAWTPSDGGSRTLSPGALQGSPAALQGDGGTSPLSAFSLSTSPRESAAPPPQQLAPSSPPPPSGPPSLPLSPIDHGLRRILYVDERGPSVSLLAILGGLGLVQVCWILLLVATALPDRSSPLTPGADIVAPLAQQRPPQQRPPQQHPAPPTIQGAEPSNGPSDAAASEPAAASSIPTNDGSDKRAPTCEALLAGQDLREGRFPGLANDEAGAAKRALASGKTKEAHERYCRALRWDDTSAPVWSSLAQVYMLQRDAAQAATAAERGVARAPDDATAQVVLADAVVRLGEHERARTLWKRAAKLSIPDDEAFEALAKRDLLEARRAERASDLAYAERMYRRVAVLAPDRAEAPLGVSRVLLAQGEERAALVWAEYAAHVEPGLADAWVARGDALAASDEPERAREAWQRALELDARHPAATKRLASPGGSLR